MDWGLIWKLVVAWFAIVVTVFCIAGEWSVVLFSVGFGVLFGGLAYKCRKAVRPLFKRAGMNNYAGFLVLSVAITVGEETFCYLTGNRIAYPVLWVDLIMVSILWTTWFGAWYFYLSKKYAFDEKEALLLAGMAGILYEFIGSGAFLSNPFGLILLAPLAVIIYAVIFIWPMQLIKFTGKENGIAKYLVSILLPFVLTIPVAIILFVIFSMA